ncbi:hypothetical protein [uncultured Arthrobacter sp.]|uniref:hypothetical protein n=1 Tax=uncultured Arthrobacter sp. TaxID=114050 RepID=UPI0026369A73|nr:hypothetical protein [uncultured Arthrobacter sp.]
MTVFWPGAIIGPLLIAICVIGYIKRDKLSETVGGTTSQILGEKTAEKLDGSHEQRTTNLMLSLFGGMAMGFAIFIFSVTGVMR